MIPVPLQVPPAVVAERLKASSFSQTGATAAMVASGAGFTVTVSVSVLVQPSTVTE